MHTGDCICEATALSNQAQTTYGIKKFSLQLPTEVTQFGSHDGYMHLQCHYLAEEILQCAESEY
jgi:hypothetical protein